MQEDGELAEAALRVFVSPYLDGPVGHVLGVGAARTRRQAARSGVRPRARRSSRSSGRSGFV